MRARTRKPHANSPGLDVAIACSTKLRPGEVSHVNLGFAAIPLKDTYIRVADKFAKINDGWHIVGTKFGTDRTGEAMLPIKNSSLFTVHLEKGTVVGHVVVEAVSKKKKAAQIEGGKRWCARCEEETHSFSECSVCMTTLCKQRWGLQRGTITGEKGSRPRQLGRM